MTRTEFLDKLATCRSCRRARLAVALAVAAVFLVALTACGQQAPAGAACGQQAVGAACLPQTPAASAYKWTCDIQGQAGDWNPVAAIINTGSRPLAVYSVNAAVFDGGQQIGSTDLESDDVGTVAYVAAGSSLTFAVTAGTFYQGSGAGLTCRVENLTSSPW